MAQDRFWIPPDVTAHGLLQPLSEPQNVGERQRQQSNPIHVAQHVGKVWISQKNNFPTPFGAIPGHFLNGPKKITKMSKFPQFSLVDGRKRIKESEQIPKNNG